MGKIIMHDTENQTQLILQAGDEESLKKQVEGIDMLERKAKAFDEIVEVFKDYPLKTDSDVMDFIQAKLDDMEDE